MNREDNIYMNRCSFVGRVACEPEEVGEFFEFNIKQGENWIPVATKQENALDLHVNQLVFAEGEFKQIPWVTMLGEKRYTPKIVIDTLVALEEPNSE